MLAAVHKKYYKITGKRDSNAGWHTKTLITDTINYEYASQEEIKFMFKDSGAIKAGFWEANDIAHLLQEAGVVNQYDLNIFIKN